MAQERTIVHLLAGGAGGTAGAVLTCPLEVVKTRLQSSVASFKPSTNGYVSQVTFYPAHHFASARFSTAITSSTHSRLNVVQAGVETLHNSPATRNSIGLTTCIKYIVQQEGGRGLFKGLGPNLVGVAPSRAIYFCAYAQSKAFLNDIFDPETPIVHILSAACAGFTASTATNPIWFIKTRLQLDQKKGNGKLTVRQCVLNVMKTTGIQGFYRGMTASYYGISETVIHFVIYEAIKARLREIKGQSIHEEDRSTMDFMEFMAAGAVSKTIATCLAYPHEVARTRLRQEGNRYKSFWQTLALVGREEGPKGLYRGLTTQLIRQIPNTAIMMATYEAVVYLACKHLYPDSLDCDD